MQFVSVRVITDDVPRLVEVDERATGIAARWATDQFAELVGPACTLAIGSTATMPLAVAASNKAAILEFVVADVDADYERLRGSVEVVQEPTTMPWGNRSLLLRDPDGTLVNFFTPVTEAAAARLTR